MSQTARPLGALILGVPNPVSMGVVRGLMMAGHRIASVWYPNRLRNTQVFQQDRALSVRAPGLTLHGLQHKAGVAVRPVPRFRDWPEGARDAASLNVDVVISLLYPDRITPSILSAFPGRVVNLHPSLLPAYRGPDPVFNMLWDQTIAQYSGLTLHLVSPEFDRGDILGRKAVSFPANRNLTAYYMDLVKAGTELLSSSLPELVAGRLPGMSQAAQPDSPQGNRKPVDAVLNAHLTRAHVEWLCSTIPQMTSLRIDGVASSIRVTGYISGLAEKTGRPPDVSDGRVTLDVFDGQVTLRVVDTRVDQNL
jgi:methionyl-tRNA formyltransferase